MLLLSIICMLELVVIPVVVLVRVVVAVVVKFVVLCIWLVIDNRPLTDGDTGTYL